MDERRFDELSRAIARTGSRRTLLRGVLAAFGTLAPHASTEAATANRADCLPLGEKCRPRRGRPCCSGFCSDRHRCACPPENPDCDRPEPTATAQPTGFVAVAEPVCPSTCPPETRCLNGECCPEDRVYVLCQAPDICLVSDSLRCCVGPEAGPERCCPPSLICGDICCHDDEVCDGEEGVCTGGVAYAGGVWLRRP